MTTIAMDSNKAWHSLEKNRLVLKERCDALSTKMRELNAPRKFLFWTYIPGQSEEKWTTRITIRRLDESLANIERLQAMCMNSHSITLSKEDFGYLMKTA